MKIFYIILSITCLHRASAQTILPQVVNAAGISRTANNIHFEFNLGESFTATLSVPGQQLTLGLLQPKVEITNSPLPVTGLHLTARRLDAGRVELNWKTFQEFGNKGFHVERRKENENSFLALNFVASSAPGGNSSSQLAYQQVDANSFGGKTWYRIKQEDLDGRTSYSNIALVNGGNTVSLTAWPIPAPRDFQVRFQGAPAGDLLIFDATGRLVRQVKLKQQETTAITGLPAGTYLLRLKDHPDLSQQVIIQ